MEPPKGFCATLWSFLRFLPYSVGLFLLGIIKGALICPIVCLIMILGNASFIVGLWPAHVAYAYYSIVRAKQLGVVLKLILAVGIPIFSVLWPLAGIIGSIIVGAAYGFLGPLIATFDAVGEGKANDLIHCFLDGTWSTIDRSVKVVIDFKNVCYHSYFSAMHQLLHHAPQNGELYEIRLCYTPGACMIGLLGIIVDVPMISIIAICKSPYMLFKGWKRLFHDLIGREGPFLETACVPFAGLAILLWPLAVSGAVIASMISSFFLGAYAAVIAYQETSVMMGISYVITALSIFDEYSNDVLDMQEGSCFPRLQYRKYSDTSPPSSDDQETQAGKKPPSRATSFKDCFKELNACFHMELLDQLLSECKHLGEILIAEGYITREDIEEHRTRKGGGRIISIGLPAYSILQTLVRSAEANSDGLVFFGKNEVTSQNQLKDKLFGGLFDPLLLLKNQVKAESLSDEEEKYLFKLVLVQGDSKRLRSLNAQTPCLDHLKRAKLEGYARRLRGITRTISRYQSCKRRLDDLAKFLSEDLDKKFGINRTVSGSQPDRLLSGIKRFFSRKSSGKDASNQGNQQKDQEIIIDGL